MQSFQSIDLISSALKQRGYSHTHVRIEGKQYRRFEKNKRVWTSPIGLVQYPFVSSELKVLARQKNLSYDYIEQQGYSIPRTRLVSKQDVVSSKTVSGLSFPYIVKPVNGTASNGLTRNITNLNDLKKAARGIQDRGGHALIQEQFKGKEIRLTILNGKVVSAFLRSLAQLTGDGKSTLAELLKKENDLRRNIDVAYLSYPQLTPDMLDEKYDAAYVAKKGQRVILNNSSMISGGASVYSIDDTLHDSYKSMALDMVAGLDAPFLVVDLLVHDYTQPATADSYVFLEFNTAPALKLYYSFRDGKHFDIVPKLADMIEQTS